MATLYIFAGLPGSGKTALSQRLAQTLNAVHLRIDTIEQALRDLLGARVEGEGYRLAYRIAADNLRLGRAVVADRPRSWPDTPRGFRPGLRLSGVVSRGCANAQCAKHIVRTQCVKHIAIAHSRSECAIRANGQKMTIF